MKLGRRDLELSTPDDLDDRLIELTGHSAKEMQGLLATYCPPSVVAGALLPLIKDAPPRHELAETIGKAGVNEARLAVLAQYDRILAPKKSGDGKK